MPDALTCYRHPKEETHLRCSACDRPICTRCMVYGPVGAKCRECASTRSSHVYQIAPGRLALAVLAVLGASAAAGFALQLGIIAVIWLSAPVGLGLGSLMLKVSGQKRGTLMEILTGASVALGALGGQIGWAAWRIASVPAPILTPGATPTYWQALSPLMDGFFLLAVVIATAAAVSKVRFW
ncbi:MAG: hypothetical protein IT210_23055 [Armatimonadetes bacterium]|nr:hypothetical protein [Armatimonadota bacterium]